MPTEATSAALLVAALLAAAAALAATHLERPGAADDCAAAGASVRMQLEELREELARRQQQVEHWRALEASSASLVTASERSHAACREAHEDAARQLEAALGQRTLPARSDGCEVCPLPPPPPPPPPPLVGTGRKRWPIMLAGVAKEVVEPPAAGAAQPSGADDVMLTAVVRPPEGGRAGVAGCVDEEQRYERLELPLHQAGSVLGLDAAPLAIGSMRAGERAAFFVAAGGGCPGPLGLELHLHAVAEVEDLSSDGGRSVLKRVLSPGKGRETPARGATLTVRLGSPSLANASLVPAAAAALGGDAVGRDGALSVGIDDGRVVGDALRLALHSMRRGELARVSLSQEQAALEPLLAPSRGGGGPVQAQVELISFRHQARDAAPSAASAAAAAAPPADPLAGAASLKEEGNSLFSAGRTKEACAAYSRALGMAAGGGGGGGDASRALTLALRNNLAGCELKADRPADALSHADEALLLSPGAAKPLYRRAQALLALGRVGEAAAAAERAAAANPASADVARLQASIAERGPA
ncbi:hypothetical protein EMIHUDRAFT_465658 [Emiliania huxleyi CCMP1516]|uniref:Peptidylprolyl isomerase n=2 Tax=Emiliania huxleyi TaxID=2903 RepID=A0A0D3IAE3_EMIH1|nr:hypothetical protein EMIHUDRAFT_465658 [Emiliania huxleyi CCMP1516]EOD08228.1 hypothetical protein EMIHUDRAFT_465658 [Emiliania huxleyi CCMP1516]|eukprot:XP_005760657.1 hypothetical protein EMIHUDRAFT_465658 [Emiliania huxleyi CCMP1516]